MTGFITLTRKQAKIKLQSASKARFFFQRKDGNRYERDVDASVATKAFVGNPKMRLRIRLEDSAHIAYAVHNNEEEHGYLIFFS